MFKDFPEWEWNIPTHFNIGAACSDKHLGTPQANHIAMIVEDDIRGTAEITFAELAQKTDQFAQLLRNLNVQVGDRVLIRLPNSLDYPIAFLGAMKMGAIAVPTSTLLTAEEVAYLAKDSGAKVLVTDEQAWEPISMRLTEQAHELPNLKQVFLTQTDDAKPHTHFAVNQLALKQRLGPQPLAQLAHQRGVFGPALAEQVTHAVQNGAGIGKTGFGVDEGGRLLQGVELRVGKKLVGKWFQPGFAGDHALGAALGLEGQVQVFQFLLGGHGLDQCAQIGC